MAEVWLLCEGPSDLPILSSVLTTVLAADILPKASGGGTSAANAAGYVFHNNQAVKVAYVIDRDYRRRAVAEEMLTDGKRGFMWRRHAIESYMLEPAVIIRAFAAIRSTVAAVPGGGAAWISRLPTEATVVADGLRACARARAPVEAGRFALQRLWEDLSESAGRIQQRTPSTLSGSSGADAAACKQSLVEEATRLVSKARETAASNHLLPDSIGQRYDEELTRVTAADYVSQMHFLEEFHGKDLMAAFLEWLTREHRSKLSRKTFVLELEKAISVAYQADRSLFGTDDFLDLANGVRALAGLPALS